MLRAAQKNEIIKTINNSNIFDFYDFKLEEKNNDVGIIYLHSEKNFHFNFKLPEKETIIQNKIPIIAPEKKSFIFNGYMRPGRVSDFESFSVEGVYDLYNLLKQWLSELDIELTDLHIQRKLTRTEEKVEDFFNKISEMTEEIEDTFFTKEEADNLKEKLDTLENSIIENLKNIMTDKVNLEKEVNNLKKEIEKLKQSTVRISKKNWAKKCFNKMGEWATNPDKRKLFIYGIKFIGGATKLMGIEGNIDKEIIDLLPDSIQEVIPENLTDK